MNADLRILIHDDPLAGPIAVSLERLVTRVRASQLTLLRCAAEVDIAAAVGSFARTRILDPALLGTSEDPAPIQVAASERYPGLLVVDGLERASRRCLRDCTWLDQLRRAHDAPLVVVSPPDLPRPAGLDLDLDALVVGASLTDEVSRVTAQAHNAFDRVPAGVAEHLAAIALSMESSGSGCAVEVPYVRQGSSLSAAAFAAASAAAAAEGLLSVVESGARQRFVFPESWMKVASLAWVLRDAALKGALPSEALFEVHAYFAEFQDLEAAVRTWVWRRAAATALGLSGVRSDHLLRVLAAGNPLLAGMAVTIVGPEQGMELAGAVVAAVARSDEQGLSERATRAMVLHDLGALTGDDLSLEVKGEGVSVAPVTNREYEAFVRDGGYQQRRWWTDSGWRWRRNFNSLENVVAHWRGYVDYLRSHGLERLRLERGWRPERYRLLAHLCSLTSSDLASQIQRMMTRSLDRPAYYSDARLNCASKPVVGVTLFEAEAYCAWLSNGIERLVRLPTVSEWEAAFSDSSLFPWGANYETGRANTLEAGLGSTTPLGAFECINGRYDMCGNVWEWTSTEWSIARDGTLIGKTFGDARYHVVKGGSWDNLASYGRRDALDVDPLELFGSRLGFRIFVE